MHSTTTAVARLLLLTAILAACDSDVTRPATAPAPPPISANIASTVGSPGISDGKGTAWRQLTETVGLTWNQVAQLCPRDGAQPCWGSLGAVDLSGWVWATDEQVVQLIARYEPTILTSRSISGPTIEPGIAAFFAAFQPTTTGGCSGSGYIITCSFGAHASGWTATSPGVGSAVSATVQTGFFAPPFIQLSAETSVNATSSVRGLYMWRADGSGGTGIVAHDDSGSVDAPSAGVVVANVFANDSLAGAPATAQLVTLSELSTTHPGVSLNVADGSVNAVAGIRVGTQTLRYRVCETARPSNCDDAVVRVTLAGNLVDAVDDVGAAKTGGGTAVANVLANDTIAGREATIADVAFSTVSPDADLTLSAAGAVIVNAGATPGAHQLTYEICEIANPTNCDRAVAVVTVSAYVIDAVSDAGSAPSAPGGTAVANVLTNDTFDGVRATVARVTLSLVSPTSAGVTLDVVDGSVDVAPGTPGGAHVLMYRICETARPVNCDQAAVSVTVAPQGYVISNDRLRVKEGSGGSFTVKLLQPPTATVTTAVSYLAGTLPVTASPVSLTFTPANWNTPQTVSFTTVRDSDKEDNAGTLSIAAPGIAPRHVVISGVDGDRKGTLPVVIVQAPYNGQTVSGSVNFWGTATDTDGTVVEGKFYVEANRIATVASNAGTFRAPAWNSATVPNGWYSLSLRVTDNAGNDSRTVIRVLVQN